MSKKDKRKKAKSPPSAWITDLRRSAPWNASSQPAPAPAPQEEITAMSPVIPSQEVTAVSPNAEASEVSEDSEVAEPGVAAEITLNLSTPDPVVLDPEGLEPTRVYPPIPRHPRVPDTSFASADPPSSGYELSEETQADIAPIGPTEYAFSESLAAPPESARPRPAASREHLEQQIKDLEARLDEMIGRKRASASSLPPPPAAPIPPPAPSAPRRAPEPASDAARADESSPGATAKEVLSSDFYHRQWGRQSLRTRSEDVDEFGHDPAYEAKFLPFFDFLFKTYFRVEVEGTSNIPNEGRCLVVGNHSGGPLPYDGVMLRTVVRREHENPRELRWLAEDFIYYLPFVGAAMNRLGAVRACQENAERLLAEERLVAVFPEGAKGIGKLYKDRYRLQRFGRGGFIRLCLRTQTPIVPCAIVGAEEANPMLYRIEYMAKTLGIPYLPITPTFPALGPLGLLPAPTKWRVVFGEPLSFDGYGPEAADDDILVGRLAERVRTTIQGMLDRMVSARKSVWFG
jgi:1-acyl-sn-glycerol-3-phosphate acyltransferase